MTAGKCVPDLLQAWVRCQVMPLVMSISALQVAQLYAVLAIVAQAAIIGLVIVVLMRVVGGETGAGSRAYAWVLRSVGPQSMAIAWLAAVLATGGSLWFSHFAHFTPCLLCWFQRTMMYPLVFVAGVGALTRDARAWMYTLPLALTGIAISIYHYQLEWFPDQHGACDPTNPCTLIWFREFGYITMPMLAMTAFAVVIAASLVSRSYWIGKAVLNDPDTSDRHTSIIDPAGDE